MKIFVDADACPVVHIVEKLAKKYEISETFSLTMISMKQIEMIVREDFL